MLLNLKLAELGLKPVEVEELPEEIVECAERWGRRKLWRKCYKLKKLKL